MKLTAKLKWLVEPPLETIEWWKYRKEQEHYPPEHQNMGQCFVDGYRRGKKYMRTFVYVAFAAGCILAMMLCRWAQ